MHNENCLNINNVSIGSFYCKHVTVVLLLPVGWVDMYRQPHLYPVTLLVPAIVARNAVKFEH